MGWMVSLQLTTVSHWAPLCDELALQHPTLLYISSSFPTSPTSLPSLHFQLMIFCSITKQKNQRRASSYFHHKLLASTLKSTTDLNSCPHSLHPPSYFNGCHPSHPFPPWPSTKQTPTTNSSFQANKKPPPLTPYSPSATNNFSALLHNRISCKTCHTHISNTSSSLKPSGILSLPIFMGTLLGSEMEPTDNFSLASPIASSLY